MMKDILFRARKVDKDKWIYGAPVKNCEECIMVGDVDEQDGIYELWKNADYVSPKTIGQYVGIDDINGKHIFEGDIVKIVTPNDDEDLPFVTEYYEIGYNEKQRAFVLRSDCGDEPFDFLQEEMDEYKVEVIGNIYENEDLRGKVYGQ